MSTPRGVPFAVVAGCIVSRAPAAGNAMPSSSGDEDDGPLSNGDGAEDGTAGRLCVAAMPGNAPDRNVTRDKAPARRTATDMSDTFQVHRQDRIRALPIRRAVQRGL